MACTSCNEKPKRRPAPAPRVSSQEVNAKTDGYVRARAAVCALCEHNDAGICTELKKATPERPCEIPIGIEMPAAYCPAGRWNRHNVHEYPKRDKCRLCGGWSMPATSEFCRQCVNRMEVDRRNLDRGVGFNARTANAGRSAKGINQQQRDMWDAVRNNPTNKSKRSSFTALYDQTQYLTVENLASDSFKLASVLPPDIGAICGVARSGMTPANIIATMLHLPLLAIRQTRGDVIEVGNGWRMGGQKHIEIGKDVRVAVIDDTSMTGNSFKAIEPIAKEAFKSHVTACLYVNPLSSKKPDYYVHELAWPHLLEWNLFNSVLSPNAAVDFDGILCHDCAPWQDDDGVNYRGFINNAIPKYLPRKVAIPLIVTARIEKYREETESWLKRHGVSWHRLIMHPAKTLAERRRDDIAAYKARHFDAWARQHHARPKPSMFIESDDAQARRISEITKRMVVCPLSAQVYGSPKK